MGIGQGDWFLCILYKPWGVSVRNQYQSLGSGWPPCHGDWFRAQAQVTQCRLFSRPQAFSQESDSVQASDSGAFLSESKKKNPLFYQKENRRDVLSRSCSMRGAAATIFANNMKSIHIWGQIWEIAEKRAKPLIIFCLKLIALDIFSYKTSNFSLLFWCRGSSDISLIYISCFL